MHEDGQYTERAHASSEDRRARIRVPQTELHCSLGQVLDISSTGLRVVCRRIPRDEVTFKLNTKVDPLPVQAKVVWAKRLGFRKHEIGLLFIQPSPELDDLIRCCSTLDGKVCLTPA